MFIETKKYTAKHTRLSKLGHDHEYTRTKTLAVFRCDECGQQFERELGKMDHRRLNNQYFHVCTNCNPKKFAQKKAAEKRTLWEISVDTDIDISRY
jgi:predicted RNA-binding Zn-ribbon protein involved in translation (DUF1610 family)